MGFNMNKRRFQKYINVLNIHKKQVLIQYYQPRRKQTKNVLSADNYINFGANSVEATEGLPVSTSLRQKFHVLYH